MLASGAVGYGVAVGEVALTLFGVYESAISFMLCQLPVTFPQVFGRWVMNWPNFDFSFKQISFMLGSERILICLQLIQIVGAHSVS